MTISFYEQDRARAFRELRQRHDQCGPVLRCRIGLRRLFVLALLPIEFVFQIAVGLWRAVSTTAFAVRHGWTEAAEHVLEVDARKLRAKFPTPLPTRPEQATPTEARGAP